MSHTKPWRNSTIEERLDGENGLLLMPTIDHLFDKGFISFEDKGDLMVSPVADRASLVAFCDLKDRSRPASQVPTPRVHRAQSTVQ